MTFLLPNQQHQSTKDKRTINKMHRNVERELHVLFASRLSAVADGRYSSTDHWHSPGHLSPSPATSSARMSSTSGSENVPSHRVEHQRSMTNDGPRSPMTTNRPAFHAPAMQQYLTLLSCSGSHVGLGGLSTAVQVLYTPLPRSSSSIIWY